jgi:hypothetical protein
MPKQKPKAVREQVVVYLDARDRELLEDLAERTGLARTELFRRGLRRLAAELPGGSEPGASLSHLIATAQDDGLPPDVAEHHDAYLYGGGYPKKRKRARPR